MDFATSLAYGLGTVGLTLMIVAGLGIWLYAKSKKGPNSV